MCMHCCFQESDSECACIVAKDGGEAETTCLIQDVEMKTTVAELAQNAGLGAEAEAEVVHMPVEKTAAEQKAKDDGQAEVAHLPEEIETEKVAAEAAEPVRLEAEPQAEARMTADKSNAERKADEQWESDEQAANQCIETTEAAEARMTADKSNA